MPSSITTSSKEVHPEKGAVPIEVIDPGNEILFNDVQVAKA